MVFFVLPCPAGQTGQTGAAALQPDTDYAVVENGANYRVWEKTGYELAPDGSAAPKKHRYTELATGLYHQENGRWVESRESIEPYATGAIARAGQYQVIFANNLNSPGAIDEQTPDGKRLRSNVLGLDYFDPATGKSALIAAVQDSQGQLISGNQVLYPDAFKGLKADVKYTYKIGSFEQDVILREQPPAPEAYGLSSKTTVLEVLTEFVDAPAAKIVTHPQGGPVPTTEDISWGAMRIGNGKAFDLGGGPDDAHVAVSKQYVSLAGRQVLLEQVPVPKIRASVSALPTQSSRAAGLPGMASGARALPRVSAVTAPPQAMKLAERAAARPGYVLDYVELNSDQENYTFQGDTTYYIANSVNFDGNVVIEGGTVVKIDTATNNPTLLQFWGGIDCATGPYRPAVFTSVNDNTVGEPVTADTGAPLAYYWGAIAGSSSSTVVWHDLTVKYARYGIDGYALQVHDCQFADCLYALLADLVYGGTCGATNVLIVNGGAAFTGENFAAAGYQCTVNGCTNLTQEFDGGTGSTLALTNSLLVNVSGAGPATVTTNHTAWTTGSGVLLTVGGGSSYLVTNSVYHQAGTTNVGPAVLADLAGKTTWPPVVYSNATLSAAQTFNPQARRETNGAPDLGYHYYPLDYVFGGASASSNLTFTAGTVMGWFNGGSGEGRGVSLNGSAQATFTGTATNPCVLARNDMVQESVNGYWTAESYLGAFAGYGGHYVQSNSPTVNLLFTHAYAREFEGQFFRDSGDGTLLVINANNSEFYDGGAGGYLMYFNFTNCLSVRSDLGAQCDCSPRVTMVNCTFAGGALSADHWSSTTWPVVLKNCAFDGTDLSQINDYSGGNTNITYCNFNSFDLGAERTPVEGANDLTITNGYNWQTSWLGSYYLPSNSPLINRGSAPASAIGLSGFTTQNSQIPEGSSTVDIGYHYLAMPNPFPVITQQPTNEAVAVGGTAVFSVAVSGVGPDTYEWLFDGVPIDVITTVAGDYNLGDTYSGDGGAATNAGCNYPDDVAVDGAGNLYFSDTFNQVVRKVGTNGIITTVAGNNSLGAGYSGDGGAATNATLNFPDGIAVDGAGNLYIADFYNNVIRKVDAGGIITTVAGNSGLGGGYSGDGDWATNAALNNPAGVTVDGWGNLYIADYYNSVIREVGTNGIISTVAGNNSLGAGYAGDGGAATDAQLSQPSAVAVDAEGDLYICDGGNDVIRQVDTNGIITTVAGNNSLGAGYSGDGGAATNATLNDPDDVKLDGAGNLYISEYYNNVIREVGANGIITTAAGNYNLGGNYSGDGGPATNAALNNPTGVAIDGRGSLYIADAHNNVIRKVTNVNFAGTISNGTLTITGVQTNQAGTYQVIISNPYDSTNSAVVTLTPYIVPAITQEPANQVVLLGENVRLAVTATGLPAPSYQWFFNLSALPGATSAALVLTNFQTNDLGGYYVVVTNNYGAVVSSVAWLTNYVRVYAGTNQVITNNNSAAQFSATQLHGVAYDLSGHPPDESFVCTWSVVSAPTNATVWFADVNLTNTIVTFNNSPNDLGAYRLRLTVSNNEGTNSSDVYITITSSDVIPYGGTNYLYIYAAGDIYSNFYTTNYNTSAWTNGEAGFGNNNGCVLVPNTDWPGNDGGDPYLYVRRHFSVPVGTTNLDMGFTVDNDAQIFLNGVLIVPTNVIFNGVVVTQNVAQAIYNGGNGFSTNYDDGGVLLTNYYYHSGCCAYDDLILNGLSPKVWHTNDNVLAVRIYDDGAVSFFDNRISLLSSLTPSNQPPVVFAGENQYVPYPQWIELNGTVIDDGLPGNGLAAATWSELSGPDTNVVFSPAPPTDGFTNFVDVAVSAGFDLPGTYVLQLVANDGQLSSTGYVSVFVDDGSVPPPVVSLITPTNEETCLSGIIPVSASASASTGAVAYVEFYANGALIGRALNYPFAINWIDPTNGNYQLTAVATDAAGRVGSSSPINVQVNYGVYAGPDQSITNGTAEIGTNSVELQGSVFDGFGNPPLTNLYTATWSEVNGPANSSVIFANPGQTNTTVTFVSAVSSLGTYQLRLTVTSAGGQVSSQSDVFVTVGSTDIIPYGGTNYLYIYATNDIYTNFYTTNYNTAGWTNGQAGFGNGGCSLIPNTDWPGNGGGYPYLYVRRHFNVPAGTTNLTMGFTVDNDAQIFLNGILVTPINTVFNGAPVAQNIAQAIYNGGNEFSTNYNDGGVLLTNYFIHANCCAYDDLVLNGISTNLWHTNDNVLAVRVYDNGGVSFFDNRISIISSGAP